MIKDNSATIESDDILTVIDPKEDLKEYYSNVINTTQMKLLQDDSVVKNLKEASDEVEEEDEEDPEGSLTKQELFEIINRKRTNRLH